MMVKSISPLAAPMRVVNFWHTPCNIPSLLLSASVFRKFLTVSPLSNPPRCRWSSWIIWDLSPVVRAGAVRMTGSLGSLLKTSARAARDCEVASRADVLTAAVYCLIVRTSSEHLYNVALAEDQGGALPMHLHRSHQVHTKLQAA